jgi:type IV pilus assembly protein PilM
MGLINTKNQLSAIGLEIDAHEFRAVQLMRSPKGVSTVAWAIFPRQCTRETQDLTSLPESEELRWAASILGRRGFVGKKVSTASSTAQSSSHVFELPPAESGAPIDQLARMEVARARRCGPEDFEFGFWPLPAKGRTAETIAVALPRTVIHTMIERYQDAGLELVGIDLMELAVHRGSTSGVDNVTDEINASLHIGWSSSLAVLTLGETVIYVRRIERGVSGVWELAKERYGLSDRGADTVISDHDVQRNAQASAKMRGAVWAMLAADLASELDVAIAYVSHSFRMAPFGKIQLSGYGTANEVILNKLDQILGIPVECSPARTLIEGVGTGDNTWATAGRLSTAYGLAARFDR